MLAVADTSTELIRIVPGILWVAFAIVALLVLRDPIRRLIPRLSAVKLPFGIELTIEKVSEAARKHNVTVSEDDKSRIANRLARAAGILGGARILWIDDEPTRNLYEASALLAYGCDVRFATTSREAARLLDAGHYDVVV